MKSNRCNTVAYFMKKIENNTGDLITTVDKDGGTQDTDTRSRAWYGVPLMKFVQPLLDKRSELKKRLKKLNKGTPEYVKIDAEQNDLKETIK